jgi:hypothetical protein
MNEKYLFMVAFLLIIITHVQAQQPGREDSAMADTLSLRPVSVMPVSTGWANQAVTMGYITAPSVLSLMFVSALVNEWNAGIAGIPASAMILLAPPLIYAGGRSVDIRKDLSNPRARLGWTLYAISIIPTSFALYGFTTEWGATLPLTIASGILGTASIVAMTTYAFSRAETARRLDNNRTTTLQWGLSPLAGGAMATLVFRF